MPAFKHVLVATDFGKPAARAEALGVDIAEKCGARLTLVFVFSAPRTCEPAGGSIGIDQLEHAASRALQAKTTGIKERLTGAQGVLRTGNAWEEILEVAKETGADLIVMGTRGRRGLPRALLGSVAERVVRMARIPVLTVAAREDEQEAHPGQPFRATP